MLLPPTRGMELLDWENAISYVLGVYIPVPTMPSEDWQHWGLLFFQNLQLAPLNPPNPYEFTDWHQWGDRLCDAFSDGDGVLGAGSNSAGSSPTSAFLITQSGLNIQAQDGNFLATQ